MREYKGAGLSFDTYKRGLLSLVLLSSLAISNNASIIAAIPTAITAAAATTTAATAAARDTIP